MSTMDILESFARHVEKDKLPLEGIAAADATGVIYEKHFCYDQPRNIYSHTKSFLSTAVGIAIGEGKLALTDRLYDRFPQELEAAEKALRAGSGNQEADMPDIATQMERLSAITLRDLLTMASGHDAPLLMGVDRRVGAGFPDYVTYYALQPMRLDPGTRFAYSTGDSIMAGRMVEKAVGERLDDYLYRRVLQPLEIGWPIWECCPMGHPIGGGGMFLKLTDQMKLGQLYLNKGRWQGEEIVPAEWVKAAGSAQIDNTWALTKPDVWCCGYGYQFWMLPFAEAYRADGAYGQITAILPEKGLVVSIQCPEEGQFSVRDAFHGEVLTRL